MTVNHGGKLEAWEYRYSGWWFSYLPRKNVTPCSDAMAAEANEPAGLPPASGRRSGTIQARTTRLAASTSSRSSTKYLNRRVRACVRPSTWRRIHREAVVDVEKQREVLKSL